MPASDYEVSDQAGDDWEAACEDEDNKQEFQNSGNSENASEWQSGVSGSGDAYEAGVADYLNEDESAVSGGDAFSGSANDSNAQEWAAGVSESGDAWSEGCSGKGDEYVQNANASQQEWFENYSEYYTD